MIITLDYREGELITLIERILENDATNPQKITLKKENLTIGDILIEGRDGKPALIIERKTFSDLVSSIKDGRYEEQSFRLFHSSGIHPHNIVYLIEGQFIGGAHTKNKNLIYSTMVSLLHFKGFSVMRTNTIYETADFIVCLSGKMERDFLKNRKSFYGGIGEPNTELIVSLETDAVGVDTKMDKKDDSVETELTKGPATAAAPVSYSSVIKSTKKENITKENIGEIILCQIPGVSSLTAKAIMGTMTSFSEFMEKLRENPAFLDTIYTETNGKKRKIGSSVVKSIKDYLL